MLTAAVAGLLLVISPAVAQATSLGVTFPTNGSVFKGAPYDVYGTNGNNFLEDGITRVSIQRELPNGTLDVSSPSGSLFKQPTLGGSLAESFEGGYWAWSHEEETEGFLYTYYTHYPIPTADGQWRVITEQNTGEDDGNRHIAYGPPVTYTIDTIAPDTKIDSGPNPIGSSSNAHFVFSGTDANPPKGLAGGIDYFQCRVDSSTIEWEDCTTPVGSAPYTYDLTGVTEGGHTIEVRALDKASNEDKTPASYFWGVDKTPPEITIAKPVDKDHYVLHQNVIPEFSCKDPLKGVAPATPFASGVATCTATPIDTATLGPHLFTVRSTDKAGNESTKTIAYVVDPPRYGDLVMEDHPLAYYRLGDPIGQTTMLDSSGRGHDGEYKGDIALRRDAAPTCERRPHPPRACELTADPQDWAADFPGHDGYGFVNGITAPQSAYTLEAWVDPADSNDMSILDQGGAGQLFISGGHLALRQTQDTVYGGGPTLTPGQWWHVAATWDGHTTRLYVDGQEVGSSTEANKPPSGSATFYVGYGDQAPWFHGTIDEAAYYDSALSAGTLADHYAVGTASDHPSPTGPDSTQTGPENTDTAGPTVDPTAPSNGGYYAPGKVPAADFACNDPDGPGDIASCTATVDGTPIADGDPLPEALGTHAFTVTAVDKGGNEYVHTHTYTVTDFASIFRADHPVAYYRLGDSGDTMADSSGNGHDGTYKNDTESGPVGISGDGDHARLFTGEGGYGYVSGIQAPRFQSTLEAWVHPDDARDESIAGQGDAGELFIQGGQFAFRHMGQTVYASVGPNPGHWSQVVGVWDGVSISIYVDGILRGSVDSTERPSSSSTFYVGYGELEPWFKGAIDEVAYYDTALTPARVYQHFLADPPPVELAAVGGEAPAPSPAPSSSGPSSAPAGSLAAAGPAIAASGAKAAGPKPARCAKRKGVARKVCLKHFRRAKRHR